MPTLLTPSEAIPASGWESSTLNEALLIHLETPMVSLCNLVRWPRDKRPFSLAFRNDSCPSHSRVPMGPVQPQSDFQLHMGFNPRYGT